MKKLLAAISILIILSSCASPSSIVKKNSGKSVEKNILTNLPGKNGPLLAVKIDDTTAAHPQVGLGAADVVYIEQVEGGLTRLAAIFTDKVPALIGPVRSARISDIEILAQYGRVGFAYSGRVLKISCQRCKLKMVNPCSFLYSPIFSITVIRFFNTFNNSSSTSSIIVLN